MLTDIVTVLLHPKLQEELFIPQPVATHAAIKQLLQDISAASIMKLDDYSMNKLWDLMTMIFKWQLSIANNQSIFDISRRHLKGIASLMPPYFSKSYIEIVLSNIESFQEKISDDDYKCLYSTMILWFSEYHTKISVLLRLGLQNKDGTFNSSVAMSDKISQNLGENIYKYDNKKKFMEEYANMSIDSNEINCLLSHIEGMSKKPNIQIQLPTTNEGYLRKKTLDINTDMHFEQIKTSIKSKDYDLSFIVDTPKSTQEDLLELLEKM